MERSELVQTVINWNNRFPLDRWWRAKYNIPFMSSAHRESSFIHQLIEFKEDEFFIDFFNKKTEEKYIPDSGDIFKTDVRREDTFEKEALFEINEILKLEEDGGR